MMIIVEIDEETAGIRVIGDNACILCKNYGTECDNKKCIIPCG